MVIKQCVVCGGDFVATGQSKTCSKKCSKEKDLEYDRRYRAARFIVKQCVVCSGDFVGRGITCSSEHSRENRAEQIRKWGAANPEKRRAAKRKYLDANVESIRQRNRELYAINVEKIHKQKRKWRGANREYAREKNFRNNVETSFAVEYLNSLKIGNLKNGPKRIRNREYDREYSRKWAQANPEKIRKMECRKRAKRRAAVEYVNALKNGVLL